MYSNKRQFFIVPTAGVVRPVLALESCLMAFLPVPPLSLRGAADATLCSSLVCITSALVSIHVYMHAWLCLQMATQVSWFYFNEVCLPVHVWARG